jgi:hypothetical protein
MTRWESYQIANRLQQLQRWLHIVLILCFIGGLNYLAMQQYERHDLTREGRYSLSPETRAFLENLTHEVRVIVTIPPGSPRQEERLLYRYVDNLLDEYRYLSRGENGEERIRVEVVDIYKDLERADALARSYGLQQVNSVLVLSGERRRLLEAGDLMEFDGTEPMAYTGEAALTSAIMEVTQDVTPTLYFLKGHNEMDPSDTHPQEGLSELTDRLQERNYTLRQLDLTSVPAVPDDAAAILIADPRGPLLTGEVEKLRTWLLRDAGRLLLWLRPGVETGMRSLFAEWGLYLPDHRLVEPDPRFRESSGGLLFRNFADHPVMNSLIENQTFLRAEAARPVIPVEPRPPDERLSVSALFATSGESWSEPVEAPQGERRFDPDVDLRGPVSVGAAGTRGASTRLGIKVPGGRVIVLGAPRIFSNQHVSSLGNTALFFNCLDWLLERDRYLAIPPRPVETYRLTASREELQRIGLFYLTVPGAVAVLGFLVFLVRRT